MYARTHLPRTDNPHNRRRNQHPIIPINSKHNPTSTHQTRPKDQNPPPPQPICEERQHETDDHIAQERQAHERPDPRIWDAHAGKVQREDESGGAVGEEADEALQAEEFGVAGRGEDGVEPELGGEPGEEVRCVAGHACLL